MKTHMLWLIKLLVLPLSTVSMEHSIENRQNNKQITASDKQKHARIIYQTIMDWYLRQEKQIYNSTPATQTITPNCDTEMSALTNKLKTQRTLRKTCKLCRYFLGFSFFYEGYIPPEDEVHMTVNTFCPKQLDHLYTIKKEALEEFLDSCMS